MKESKLSRRTFLRSGSTSVALCILGVSAIKAVASEGKYCVDPAKLRKTDRSLRDSLQYVPEFSDRQAVCATCAFFQASTDNFECGKCMILNGIVEAMGHCISWGPKG